jgi:hypothetical protein
MDQREKCMEKMIQRNLGTGKKTKKQTNKKKTKKNNHSKEEENQPRYRWKRGKKKMLI